MIYLREKIAKYRSCRRLRTRTDLRDAENSEIFQAIDESCDKAIDESCESDSDSANNSYDSESDSEWPSLVEQSNSPRKKMLFGRSHSLFENDAQWTNELYKKAGLYEFLKTNAGGNISNNNAKTTCYRLSSFITWVIKILGVNEGQFDTSSYIPTNPLLTVMELLVKNPSYLGNYLNYLASRNASPSTQLTVLCQLKKCALWSLLFSPIGTFLF